MPLIFQNRGALLTTAGSELAEKLISIQRQGGLLQRLACISADSMESRLVDSNMRTMVASKKFEELLKTTVEAIQNE